MGWELEDVEKPFVAQLEGLGWVHDEGDEALFGACQLLVATCYDEARVGCIGARFEHYAQWKTVVGPDGSGSEIEEAQKLGKSSLSEQERMVAGLLAPAHLLDVGGTSRCSRRSAARLKAGKTRLQHGEHDQRGGIIWHTQGSGKSLTMVFLVRKTASSCWWTRRTARRRASCMTTCWPGAELRADRFHRHAT